MSRPSQEQVDVLIVGAGAAGLWAADALARSGAERGAGPPSVLLLERTARAGTKVLASGGTRCNLTTTLEPGAAAALFGPRAERFLLPALWNLPPEAVRARFHELGVATVEAPLEKVFPASGRARDVRDALERAARSGGARIEFGARVAEVGRDGQGWWVRAEDGRRFSGRRLMLCPGGKSYPRAGTTGDGYAWLESLGLPLVRPVPGLVPLVSPEPWVHELSGIAPQDVDVRLIAPGGRTLAHRRRPVVFTQVGLSGPGAMDLSEPVSRWAAEGARGRPHRIALDLAPDLEREELRALLVEAAGSRGAPRLSRACGLELPRRLWAAVCAQAGLTVSDPRVVELDRGGRHELIETLKGLRLDVTDTLGDHKAEVTAGGLALSVVDPDRLAVRGLPGLYVFGELLDVQGPIGGLNFQAAWATAELAALDAVRSL
jgi:predicted Rossmann fold flavoprotein